MSDAPTQPPGWYYAQGDAPGTQRYWDGQAWQGEPQPVPGGISDPRVGASSNLGGQGQRIGARIIDTIIWTVIGFIVAAVFNGGDFLSAFSAERAADVSYTKNLIASLAATAAVSAYEIMMVANRGQTLGKMAFSLRVTNEDGSAVDMQTSARRFLTYIVPAVLLAVVGPAMASYLGLIPLLLALAGLVMLFTDDRRQLPWDKIAKTIVVDN